MSLVTGQKKKKLILNIDFSYALENTSFLSYQILTFTYALI